MVKKLPKLMSIRQAAEATGKTRFAIWYAIKHGRISEDDYQLVDGRYILAEWFRIREHGVQRDPFLDALPTELTALGLDKDLEAITDRHMAGNPTPSGYKRVVRLPGFARQTEGLSANEIYRLTKVHFNTQARILEGKPVRAAVALRLARGLGIAVEDLLA